MECREAAALIDPYLDGELALERALELEGHLAGCHLCAEELARQKALKTALREKLARHRAQPSLRRALGEAIARQDGRAASRSLPPPAWLRMAASFLLVAALSSALTWHFAARDRGAVPDEVFASHVRAMLSQGRGIDVASTDEHTVKPWFSDKLDFSPPVEDLASEGYPLAGGRLDYIAGRRVAALVYQHRKHWITLFVWPAGEPQRALAAAALQGDNLVHWSDGRMSYWAVSDLNGDELKDFATKFQAAVPPRP